MQSNLETKLLVEQHFHGAYGVYFNTAKASDINDLAKKLLRHGIGGFFPTLLTDTVENINKQIKEIKQAKANQNADEAEILGIHLEGIFINPEKKGIHDKNLMMKPTVENYKKIEDDFIKIVTLAPELDEGGQLRKYLHGKGVKVQAGHCVGGDLTDVDGVTHIFNAMGEVHHRQTKTALTSLVDDKIYTEVIADGVHLSADILKLIFKTKPSDKVILISDCLPVAHSGLAEMMFAGQKVFYDGKRGVGADGTLAGSTLLLDEIVKRLGRIDFVENVYKYHNLDLSGKVVWDKDFNVVEVVKGDKVVFRR